MTHEQMTVHKALAELKTLSKRIEKEVDNSFVVAKKASDKKIDGILVSAFEELIKSTYQRATALIERRDAIKRAVVLSNAKTEVLIGKNTYTVAEAIEMKNHGIPYRKFLLHKMSTQYEQAKHKCAQNEGDALEQRAEDYVLNIISAQPKESKMTKDSEAMKKIREEFIQNNTYVLVDPLNIADKIKKLDEEIDTFMTEVDSALSVSNALTVIEIDY